jgi:hypothetical protein
MRQRVHRSSSSLGSRLLSDGRVSSQFFSLGHADEAFISPLFS